MAIKTSISAVALAAVLAVPSFAAKKDKAATEPMPPIQGMLGIPSLPTPQPPDSLDPAAKKWLQDKAALVAKQAGCAVKAAGEEFCRVKSDDGRWFGYDGAKFWQSAVSVFWQVAAAGELRPTAPLRKQAKDGKPSESGFSDFAQDDAPIPYVQAIAMATMLQANGIASRSYPWGAIGNSHPWDMNGAVNPVGTQTEIVRSAAFQGALTRAFVNQYPQYAGLASVSPLLWRKDVRMLRAKATPDLYRALVSRNIDEAVLAAMNAEDDLASNAAVAEAEKKAAEKKAAEEAAKAAELKKAEEAKAAEAAKAELAKQKKGAAKKKAAAPAKKAAQTNPAPVR